MYELFLLFLLVNPWLDWTRIEQKPQSIAVIYDLSESMFNHLEDNPLQYVIVTADGGIHIFKAYREPVAMPGMMGS